MSVESAIFDALKGIVENRVYPDVFPQDVVWPAIRYSFVSVVPETTVCGSGDDTVSDSRIQIDGVAKTGAARDALRLAIRTAMNSYPIPNTVDSWSKDYDTETKAYRVQLDYILQPSG